MKLGMRRIRFSTYVIRRSLQNGEPQVMAHPKSGSSGGICIYTRTQIWTGTSHWRAVKKKGSWEIRYLWMGKLGLGHFFRGSSRCVCVWPQKERKKGDGWIGNFPRQRRTCDWFDFSKAPASTLGRTWSITYLIGITHSVAKREEEEENEEECTLKKTQKLKENGWRSSLSSTLCVVDKKFEK